MAVATGGISNHPGHADQKSHGRRKKSSAAKFDAATTGEDALKAASLKSPPTDAQLVAIKRYGGDGGYVINGDLRTQSGEIDQLAPKNRASVDQLDSVMAASLLTEDIIVHRRISDGVAVFGRDITTAVPDITGASWRDHGYASTSQAERGASGRMRMRILVPKGTPAFSHPDLDSDEILLGRGLKFTVVKDYGPEVVRRIDVVVEP